ncbi:MAG: carbamoyltransferase HypF, partial [Pseudomonadota bacterium]|nr:carbamoyltransferase HypF [Pseudomonadota bacterium]
MTTPLHADNDAGPAAGLRLLVRGAVQGVGFRPFVYRLARELGLNGWVGNTAGGVAVEVEGPPARLKAFIRRLRQQPPALARVDAIAVRRRPAAGISGFAIRASDGAGAMRVSVLPDIAACPACVAEIFHPADRRYRYPFANCTDCGPRFSIIERLPYDRGNTAMRRFALCADCRAEYQDPADRRFHAQPIACPACGPQLALWTGRGRVLAERDQALLGAADFLRGGGIVAVKGLGGFHLLADARDPAAVGRLRTRKRRPHKPLAVMFPDPDSLAGACLMDAGEWQLLASPQAPIVLLQKTDTQPLAAAVAPDNPRLGAMLPYTPLHHLLLRDLGFPVVATSGNRAGEPICIDEREALARLGGIADLFLVHDRPILRPVDDSVVQVVLGTESRLRLGRGYAPLSLPLDGDGLPLLAVGAQQKNAVALAAGGRIVLGQHLGDMDSEPAGTAFCDAVESLRGIYRTAPERVACDLHPDYPVSGYARRLGLPVTAVQHHHAHV